MHGEFSDMPPLLVLAAVPAELALLTGSLADRQEPLHPAWPAAVGRLGGQRLVCCAAGPGTANAAGATAALIERYRPSRVLILGCGGAFPGSGLGVGDLAVATEELFADLGVMAPEGWLDMADLGLPLATVAGERHYNRIPLDAALAEQALCCAGRQGVRAAGGSFATVAACSGTTARGEELARRYDVICENMEGAAVALVCRRYAIPCVEIRGISNLVEDRTRANWDIPAAVQVAQRAALSLLAELAP
ncbi:futalosine hydrolase [Trichlorobacter ammonificans]|uniref:Futalosine hydrolase n=1 Tax=Trichlorobacter ammonificans TaxID=2916410 RepID=A0ABM9D3M9_9BACT|nr:futalosine hydrolase [Trichlorobacter ammonificans]CAH2029857.1 Futalosine hydrolase [Trichlorobacter ammonificans]